jgi:hypothetical protein
MESKKINQLATELAPDLSDLTIIGDPTTGISKKITLSQMASLFTGTVEEYANLAAFPLVGVADTIYIALDTNILYRWNTGTSAYVELSPNIVSSLVFNDANGFDGTINLVGSVASLTITTALTTGSVPFIGASGALTQDNANLFFDDTNNRLGINTNVPTTALDVFGSGIIGRINGTSTNNAYLGFASAGTNKWSVGNVQSDHRFRIFSEANSAELITILQTGEFGIGIANPTTKFHIDGAASALIANLDANVSVAKSISYRSDNSARINLEVSGTESGSNVGMDFFIRRYSDAGALIDTPLTITRSTGAITLAGALSGTSAIFSSTATATAFIPSGATIPTNGMYLSAANTLDFATNTTNRLTITSAGMVGIGSSTIYNAAGFNRVLSIYESGSVAISLATSLKEYQIGIAGTDSDYRIYDGTNLAYRFAINGSTGNVLIGTTTDVAGKLQVNGEIRMYGSTLFRGMSSNTLQLCGGTSSSNIKIAGTDEVITMDTNGATRLTIASNGRADFVASKSGSVVEITASRNNSSNDIGLVTALGSNANNTSSYHFIGATGGADKCYILGNGNLQNINNSYGALSDIKLKENIIDATPKLENLLKVKVRNYNLIGEENKQIGVIAQELEQIFPSMVDESEDFKEVEIEDEEGNIIKERQSLKTFTKSVKYSVFVPMLIKAMQEQQAQIEELKILIAAK